LTPTSDVTWLILQPSIFKLGGKLTPTSDVIWL
jgi:hypothetical protein